MTLSRRKLLQGVGAGLGAFSLRRYANFGAPAWAQPQPNAPRLPIGMNLAGIADWEAGFPFRNLMWGARLWMTRNASGQSPWNTEKIGEIALDENGYPLEIPQSVAGTESPQVVFTLLPNVRTAGRYVALYEGEGTLEGVGCKVVEAAPGRVVLDMKHDGETVEGLAITRSVRGNPLRNLRVVALADEKIDAQKSPFLPEVLEFCRPFHALRFMDWMHTNGSLEEEWKNRKHPTFYTMAGAGGDPDAIWGPAPTPTERLLSGGVAIELCVDLCNATNCDGWFCVPHRASDDYIAQMARLVKSRLNPNLNCYLEYSNEVWNWGFQQAQWMLRSKIAAAPLELQNIKVWDDDAKTKGSGHPERIAALQRRCFAIWEREWTGADRKRLVRVCAVQHAWFDASNRTLDWVMKNGGCDALSPAGYVGPSDVEYAAWEKAGATLTAAQVIEGLNAAFERDTQKWTRDLAAIAKKAGVRYVVYEGGQHVQPKNQAELPYMPALKAAQSDEGMARLYARNFQLHQEIGCDLFCAFSSIGRQGTRWGSWGHKATYDQPLEQAPKMRALLEANTPKIAAPVLKTFTSPPLRKPAVKR